MTDERWARAALSRLAEPCDTTVAALLERFGAVETVDRIRSHAPGLERFGARVREANVDQDLANARRIGARVVIPGDDAWPTRLDDLPIPPWCLWARGPLPLESGLRRSVAVVGARMCTEYGARLAAELAAGLVTRGWAVVSGGAFGIDAAAHRGALAVDGVTVAVLASGIDRMYPAAHGPLLERILERGACLSETAPGSAPMKSRFLHRNRLIAALTAGTVVVEADLRSGSLNTARHAVGLARPVAAVPGPVTSMSSAGCHQRIRSGEAVLVTNAEEVIELVGEMGVDAYEEPSGPVFAADGLPSAEARVLEALPVRGAMELDRVSVLTTLAPLAVRAALARLEDLGLAVVEEGRWRKARAPRV
mgnify:CR=1 FL=1